MNRPPADRHNQNLDKDLRQPPLPAPPLGDDLRRRILNALPDQIAPPRRLPRAYLATAAAILMLLVLSVVFQVHQSSPPTIETPAPTVSAASPMDWHTLALPLSQEPIPNALAHLLAVPLDAQAENLLADSVAALRFIGHCANVDTNDA